MSTPASTITTSARDEVRPVVPKLIGEPAAGSNWVGGLLRMSTYIGVSHQYKVEGPGGTELTVYVQNLGATTPPQPGEQVRLVWRPEHTFVVKPSQPLSEEEEQE